MTSYSIGGATNRQVAVLALAFYHDCLIGVKRWVRWHQLGVDE